MLAAQRQAQEGDGFVGRRTITQPLLVLAGCSVDVGGEKLLDELVGEWRRRRRPVLERPSLGPQVRQELAQVERRLGLADGVEVDEPAVPSLTGRRSG